MKRKLKEFLDGFRSEIAGPIRNEKIFDRKSFKQWLFSVRTGRFSPVSIKANNARLLVESLHRIRASVLSIFHPITMSRNGTGIAYVSASC
jgi:hypothetical protein